MNLNKVLIVGRITQDLALKTTPSGSSVLSFSLATNRMWNDKNGQKQEESQFHNCVAWGKQAELISTYMSKGCELLIEGRLQTRSWDDKKTGAKRYTTEIVVENMQFGSRPQGERASSRSTGPEDAPSLEDVPENLDGDEEIPL